MSVLNTIARGAASTLKAMASRFERGSGAGAELVEARHRIVPRKGTTELLSAYRETPILRAAVGKLAGMAARQRWHAATEVDTGEKRLPGHMMARTLNRGNDLFLSGLARRKILFANYILTGEVFEYIERNDAGHPVMLYPLPAHWVREVPRDLSEPFIVQPVGREVFEVPRTSMVWHKDPDPERPYERGTGIGFALGDELGADEEAAKLMKNVFANRARPDLVVSFEGTSPLTPEQKAVVDASWMKFRGSSNAGKPFFSGGKTTVTPVSQTFHELELVELRQYERDLIVSVCGVAPEQLGILTSSNRATIDAADFLTQSGAVDPLLEAFAATYDDQLAVHYGENVRASYDTPIREDKTFQLQAMLANPGAFTLDEHRELAGMEPLGEGEGDLFALDPMKVYERDHKLNSAAFVGALGGGAPSFSGAPRQFQEAEIVDLEPDQETAEIESQTGDPELAQITVETKSAEPKRPRDRVDTLFVDRPVINPEDIIAWAKSGRVPLDVDEGDLHVTIAASRAPVDWASLPEPSQENDDGTIWSEDNIGARRLMRLGDALVLAFMDDQVEARWAEIRDHGASWDFAEFIPHVTLSYDPGDAFWNSEGDRDGANIEAWEPYQGPIQLGPERWREFDTEKSGCGCVSKTVQDLGGGPVRIRLEDEAGPFILGLDLPKRRVKAEDGPSWEEIRRALFEATNDQGAEVYVLDAMRLTLPKAQQDFVDDLVDSFGVLGAFNVRNPKTERELAERSAWLVRRINDTTREGLQAVLSTDVRNGASLEDMRRSIDRVFGRFTGTRSETIARTEVARATNRAAWGALDNSAGVRRIQWLAVQDNRTRDAHRQMDGQTIEVGDAFRSPTGAVGLHPGSMGRPGDDINCRCTIVPVVGSLNDKAARVATWKRLDRRRWEADALLAGQFRRLFELQRTALLTEIRQLGG
ncbi:MAG: phage portal protein [Pseudomonadota bacterium]